VQELKPPDRKRILCVDGYEDNRVLLAYLLRERGYCCVAVSSVTEALAAAHSEAFDLYILDNWYSDGTGIELSRRIRRFDKSGPIIFFSAWPLETARQDAIRAGASAYLLKPALDEVLLFIRILLRNQTVSKDSRSMPEVTPPATSHSANPIQSPGGTQNL